MEGIEFTDRYGGNPPSGITACYRCEAMGCIPVYMPDGDKRTGDLLTRSDREIDPVLVALWNEAEASEPTDDGYHFVTCADCNGTGRIPLLRGLLRTPRLFWKGVKFATDPNVWRFHPEGTPIRKQAALIFKIAFLQDWLRLFKWTRRWAIR